jgi:hypothetical protein
MFADFTDLRVAAVVEEAITENSLAFCVKLIKIFEQIEVEFVLNIK